MMKVGEVMKFLGQNWEGVAVIVIVLSIIFLYGIMKENDVSELDKKTMDASISLKDGSVTIEGMKKSAFLVDDMKYYQER